MPADNKLELVVAVEVDRANQFIKSVNASLSSMEASATKSAKGTSQGIDGMTAAMVKGATAGSLLAAEPAPTTARNSPSTSRPPVRSIRS